MLTNRAYFLGQQAALEKLAGDSALSAAGLSALLGVLGIGALGGHAADVSKKLEHAKYNKNYSPETIIEKYPKLLGALSLGLAPALSASATSKELARESHKVRKVLAEHPFMTAGVT